MCGPFVCLSNWQKWERSIRPVWAKVYEKRLLQMLLVGVQTGKAFATGHLAIFIEIYYVFSFGPSIPLLSIYFRETLV